MLKKLFRRIIRRQQPQVGQPPTIIPRDQHPISRRDLSENVLKVLYRLDKAGYQAFLVGGAVRDLLVGRQPKDFDVATSARPEQVRALFSNCRLIGRRFRLAHIYFGSEIIEVATFRAGHSAEQSSTHSEHGMILQDNQYGTLEEDAWRRDFTVNALYYNIRDFSIVDYTGGVADIKAKQIRIIGKPEQRFREDPVRILRAIRFSSVLDMPIGSATGKPIPHLLPMLSNVSPARLFDEIVKLFHSGASEQVWRQFKHYGLTKLFFQQTLAAADEYPAEQLIEHVLVNTDDRVAAGKSVTPVFVLACLLWYPMLKKRAALIKQGMRPYPAVLQASEQVIKIQTECFSVPQRIAQAVKEIWLMQKRLEDRRRNKVARLAVEPRFRAAYDFLLLRARAGEPCQDAAEWWTEYTESDVDQKQSLTQTLPNLDGRRRRHHSKRKKTKRTHSHGNGSDSSSS